jgi:hypothetical protein
MLINKSNYLWVNHDLSYEFVFLEKEIMWG